MFNFNACVKRFNGMAVCERELYRGVCDAQVFINFNACDTRTRASERNEKNEKKKDLKEQKKQKTRKFCGYSSFVNHFLSKRKKKKKWKKATKKEKKEKEKQTFWKHNMLGILSVCIKCKHLPTQNEINVSNLFIINNIH